MDRTESALPLIPAKRYFTIGEVSELCLVKPYVLRYWEQEFVQLKPMKRRGNRRYYQHHEVLLIRRIRELLYEQGFTISGARNQLLESGVTLTPTADSDDFDVPPFLTTAPVSHAEGARFVRALQANAPAVADGIWLGPDLADLQDVEPEAVAALREALVSIRDLLS
jgi:DNA-binding transcriptional MerR regulator